ncbi:MAG TPA: nicotinate-nucleotide adenylyltransferase [Methylophilaceae bacterium]|nr:nicotinate-nucleotide adenylyltransferase [Methylophilaceae bacterium]
MQLTGILGGAFDPIHFGHLRMAQELADALELNEVRFIPTAFPPHRPQSQTSETHRIAMLRLAIDENSKFICDDLEIQRYREQQQPSYTIETLLSLKQTVRSETTLCLLLGGDAFLGLPTWHRWEELLKHCHIVVAHRPNTRLELGNFPQLLKTVWEKSATADVGVLKQKRNGHILMQPITALDISATRIRNDLRQGKNPRYLLPDAVIDYIESEKLYR